MSGLVAGFVWKYYAYGGNERMLAAKLADNADTKGRNIRPSVATLAAETMLSERTVQRLLKKMVSDGWLLIVRHAHGGGRGGGDGRPREYRISPEWIAASEMGVKLSPISRVNKVTPEAEMGDTAVAEMGDTAVTPKPSGTVMEPNPHEAPKAGAAPGFDEFLRESGYPKRARLDLARIVWTELAPDSALGRDMVRAVRAWRTSDEWQRQGGRYVPRLDKFLRDQRWLDAPGTAAEPTVPIAVVPRSAPLTTEQLAANAARAREAAALARRVMAGGQREAVAA